VATASRRRGASGAEASGQIRKRPVCGGRHLRGSDFASGSGQETDLYVGMHHSPHSHVETEFETSVLGNQVGDRHRDRASSISHRHALQFPQKPEQVVGERRLAELNVHIAAMTELCPCASGAI
jgi:hypothetical protein